MPVRSSAAAKRTTISGLVGNPVIHESFTPTKLMIELPIHPSARRVLIFSARSIAATEGMTR